MTRDLELQLIDAPAPHGEIVVKDLAALTVALQELSTRIGRDVLQAVGRGRTKQFMEEFAQLRLRAIDAGSTVLTFSQGPTDKLDVDLAQQTEADDRFWEIVESIQQNRRPEWASDLIADSAARLVNALREAAPRAVLSGSAHPPVDIDVSRISVEVWRQGRLVTDTRMEVLGRVEKVDLRSHEFRVRDDIGNSVDLKHVHDDVDVARLVGQWVSAVGDGILAAGRLVALDDVSISPVDDPARTFEGEVSQSLDELLASVPGPDPDGGIDLSEDEFADFLKAARA